MIYLVYKDRWGGLDFDESETDNRVAHMMADDFNEREMKSLRIDDWIMDYHRQLAEAEQQKIKEKMNVEEYINMKKKLKDKKEDEPSVSRELDNSKKPIDGSNDDESPGKNQPEGVQLKKKIAIKIAGKKSIEELEINDRTKVSKPQAGNLTPTRKEIKKKNPFFEEAEKRYIPRQRHENSYEDFAEFENIAPMVKQAGHEEPELRDMNQVLAEHIKRRYRSTDRFIRVQKYT